MKAEALSRLVRRYVTRTIPRDEPLPRVVRLTQTGEMQLKPGRWLPFEASQEMRSDRVEFAWRARFSLAPLLSIRVRDWYRDGEGGLDGRLLGIFPVARAGGPETARSEAMRYLAELPWCPSAILANAELEWRELDASSVEVAVNVGPSRAAVILDFDGEGEITGASASARPRQEGKRFVERPWAGTFTDYRELAGVRVPTRAEVKWELPDGPFTYFRAQITDLAVEVDSAPPALSR